MTHMTPALYRHPATDPRDRIANCSLAGSSPFGITFESFVGDAEGDIHSYSFVTPGGRECPSVVNYPDSPRLAGITSQSVAVPRLDPYGWETSFVYCGPPLTPVNPPNPPAGSSSSPTG